jgi:hypothetical protein
MITPSSRMRSLIASIGLTIGAMGFGFLWLLGGEPAAMPRLVLNRQGQTTAQAAALTGTEEHVQVVPDELRRKYDPRRRVEFRLSTTHDTSIFILETGVQVATASGWKTEFQEYRGEIWRLKAGDAREVCVEGAPSEIWRAYVRYGTEMKGIPLLRAQLREAWILRSFSNWTGKPWGGGRWSGSHELFSEKVAE